jgi:hypothetical protein
MSIIVTSEAAKFKENGKVTLIKPASGGFIPEGNDNNGFPAAAVVMNIAAEGLFYLHQIDLVPFQPLINLVVHLLQAGNAYLAYETLYAHGLSFPERLCRSHGSFVGPIRQCGPGPQPKSDHDSVIAQRG